jgi:hypothetical protein
MKLAVLLLAAAVVSPSSSSPLDEPMQLRMTEAQAAQCEAEGGCEVYTHKFLLRLIDEAKQQGRKEATEQTDSACWRSRKEV